jgi:ATP-binding cassette subfamily B protein
MVYNLTPINQGEPRQRVTWFQKVAALRYAFRLIKLVWQTHRGFTILIIGLRLFSAITPVAVLWIGKLIIDAVIAAQRQSPNFYVLGKLVVLEICLVVGGQMIARASALYEGLLGDLFSNSINVRLMQHIATLDLHHFEDSVFYDRLERARRQTSNQTGFLLQLLQLCEDVLTLVSLSAALLAYSPWLLSLLVVAVLPSFFGETHFATLGYALIYGWTSGRRRLDYLRHIGGSNETAKEVQLFGLAGWIVSRFQRLSARFYAENKRLAIRKSIVGALLFLISSAGYYTAYAVILVRTVHGEITIGLLTFLAGSFQRSRDMVQRLLLGASGIYEQALFVKDLFDVFEMKPSITSPPDAPMAPDRIRKGLVFEDVGFRYSDSQKWAVRHVSFSIAPGERVALVGENGAGKTTLVKLLARLYDVTEGRIVLDGIDIRDYDIHSVRRAIGVIFQDFAKYDFRLDENIGVGEIDEVREYLDADEDCGEAEPSAINNGVDRIPAVITSAADKSLTSGLLPRLPKGYRQMLGRRFEGGIELSGGEWQKIALARAYIRDAQVLILDEPTAALDARAEYEVFTRFSRLVTGRMAVIISHRFSTVRMADRIIVLKDGLVLEEGTHSQLVERAGLYRELFMLQAEGYR